MKLKRVFLFSLYAMQTVKRGTDNQNDDKRNIIMYACMYVCMYTYSMWLYLDLYPYTTEYQTRGWKLFCCQQSNKLNSKDSSAWFEYFFGNWNGRLKPSLHNAE